MVENTTIESLVYNGFTRDVETDLNAPRPIVAGGTGATNADEALENLHGVSDKGDTMTGNLEINKVTPVLILNKTLSGQYAAVEGQMDGDPRWRIMLGNTDAEDGASAGSEFPAAAVRRQRRRHRRADCDRSGNRRSWSGQNGNHRSQHFAAAPAR